MNPELTSLMEAPLRKTGTAGRLLLADIVSSLPKLSSDIMSGSIPLECRTYGADNQCCIAFQALYPQTKVPPS